MLTKREDGFTVSLAKWHDFPKFVESITDGTIYKIQPIN